MVEIPEELRTKYPTTGEFVFPKTDEYPEEFRNVMKNTGWELTGKQQS